MNGYTDWESFVFKRRRFLAMIKKDGNVMVFGVRLAVYGSWMSIENFKKDYAVLGEGLNLDAGYVR